MKISIKNKADYWLVLVAVALSIIGIIFIYSASNYSAQLQFGDAFHYVKTQVVALVFGLVVLALFAFVDVNKISKYSPIIYVVSLIILALVFVPVIGVESYGAKRWLNLGFFTIQPSEYAKFGMIIFVAMLVSKLDMKKMSSVLIVLLFGVLVCLLTILEPNMSITVCCFAVVFLMIFLGGAKFGHLCAIAVPALAVGLALLFAEPYRINRLLAFLDPWASPLGEGYQLIQSYYALGSGGLFGIGIFQSRQKYLFLPFAESDFILSVIGEETGLFGVLVIMCMFAFISIRGFRIAKYANSRFSSALAYGISLIIAIQSALNMAVVCGAVPPTGLPLPFVSAGGSSLVAYLGAVGILVAISRQNTRFLSVEATNKIKFNSNRSKYAKGNI